MLPLLPLLAVRSHYRYVEGTENVGVYMKRLSENARSKDEGAKESKAA